MKKASLLPLLFACALLAACPAPEGNKAGSNNGSHANNSANGGGQPVRQDVNVNVNANASVGPARTREDRTVTVVVFYDPDNADQPAISFTPEKLKVTKLVGHKVRFHVFNNLDVNIKRMTIRFKTTDPLEGGDLELTDIPPGDDKYGRTNRIKPATAAGVYRYGGEAIGDDDKRLAYVDPEIIINDR